MNEPNYKVWWDEENKLIRVAGSGQVDAVIAQNIVENMRNLWKEHGENINQLIDVSQCTGVDAKGRQFFSQVSKESKGRSAFFGASLVLRVVVDFIFGAVGLSNRMKQFATEVEAIAWLKEK